MALRRIFLLFALPILCAYHTMQAQITIGSAEEPLAGALLDLKQSGTTSKGLGLPRVTLTALDNVANGDITGVTAANADEHIGLVVYHIPANSACPTIEPGLFVWGGSQWQEIGAKKVDKTAFADNGDGTGTLTDFEGNGYTTKKFGSKWWMTQNLRSIRNAEGKLFACPTGVSLNPAYFNNLAAASLRVMKSIPEGTVASHTDAGTVVAAQTYKAYAERFGLQYGWTQASNACPAGWHLPTDTDWSDLVAAVGANEGHTLKANNGTIFRSVDGTSYTWGSTPYAASESGFNALPAGFTISFTTASSYGSFAYWWAAGTAGNYRFIPAASFTLNSDVNGSPDLFSFSVRCVKD